MIHLWPLAFFSRKFSLFFSKFFLRHPVCVTVESRPIVHTICVLTQQFLEGRVMVVQYESWCEVSNSLQREGGDVGLLVSFGSRPPPSSTIPPLPEILIWGAPGETWRIFPIYSNIGNSHLGDIRERGRRRVEIFAHITTNPRPISEVGERATGYFSEYCHHSLKVIACYNKQNITKKELT